MDRQGKRVLESECDSIVEIFCEDRPLQSRHGGLTCIYNIADHARWAEMEIN